MADHYRNLAQSLVSLGFLFRRQGERRHEVWRNRQIDQEISFDREEVARSRTAAAAVLAAAQAALPGAKPSKPAAKTAAKTTAKARSAKRRPAAKPTTAKSKRVSGKASRAGKKRVGKR